MDLATPSRRSTMYFAFGLALVAAYFVLRTAAAPELALAAWTVVACAAALVSPLAGLTVLAAIAPFTEALTDAGRVTATPFLLATLGGSLLIHAWLLRPLPRLSPALLAALGLFGVSLVGVLYSALSYGPERGLDAFEAWVPGVGGGLTALLVAAWLAWRGELRPLAVAVASIVTGALVSLADFASAGGVQHSVIGWLVHEGVDRNRLGGIIDAPNPAAALFVVGLALTLAVAVFGRRPGLRVLCGVASVGLILAIAATYSRSGLLAVAVVLSILGWRWRPWLGALLAALAAGAALLFASGNPLIRDVPQVFDEARLEAWRASISMWLAAPLTGHGFRSFEWLHASFGSALDAPHNEWLRLFAEEGTIGGLIGLAFVVAVLGTLLRRTSWPVTATGAAAAALFVMACFNNPLLYVQVTAPVLLIVGSGLGLAIARAVKPAPEESAR